MRILRHFAFSIFWTFAVFGLYAVSSVEIKQISFWDIFRFDKIAHAGVFALLCLSLIVAFRKQAQSVKLKKRAVLMSFLLSGVYGGLLELVQGTLFEGRVSDPLDFAANVVGCALGVVAFRLIYGKALYYVTR